MKKSFIAGFVALAGLASVSSVANASTIEVVLTVYNASNQQVGTALDLTPGLFGAFGAASYNGFKVVSGSATDSGTQLSSALSVAANAAARGETLKVAVIETGLMPLKSSFLTGYSNVLAPKGWTVTEQTFEGSTAIYAAVSGTSTGATSGIHSGAFTGGGTSNIAVTAPYTLEELYTVHLSSNASYSNVSSGSTQNLSYSAVPESSTWVMMLAGFAGLGFVGFSRNRKVVGFEA